MPRAPSSILLVYICLQPMPCETNERAQYQSVSQVPQFQTPNTGKIESAKFKIYIFCPEPGTSGLEKTAPPGELEISSRSN